VILKIATGGRYGDIAGFKESFLGDLQKRLYQRYVDVYIAISGQIKEELIHEGFEYSDLGQAVDGSDLIILCTPIFRIIEFIREFGTNAQWLKPGCIISDVGSTKSVIVEAAEKYFPPHVLYVGSHPMAGSEKSGIVNASADLFKGASCILTPTGKTNKLARDKVKHLWTKMGAEVKVMTPEHHDEVMAYVSHLPHFVAFALMRAIPDAFVTEGAAGLRDTTRIAASSPKMWKDICTSNYRNILKSIDDMAGSLADIRRAVVEKNDKVLAECIEQACVKRELLNKKG